MENNKITLEELNMSNIVQFYLSKEMFSKKELEKMVNILYDFLYINSNDFDGEKEYLLTMLINKLNDSVDEYNYLGEEIIKFIRGMKIKLYLLNYFIANFGKNITEKKQINLLQEISLLNELVEYENKSIDSICNDIDFYTDLRHKVLKIFDSKGLL